MATGTAHTSDLDAFKRYVDERCGGSLEGHSLSEAIAEFRTYQQQLAELQQKLRLSEQSATSEGTQPLSEGRLDEMCDQWEAELRNEGVIK